MLSQQHKVVLALLLVAKEPLTKSQVELCLQEEIDLDLVVSEINLYLEEQALPIIVQKVANGYRLVTRSEYAHYLSRFYSARGRVKLSRSALEALAIIAYKQPITKSEIDAIRGVDTNLKPLLEKNLIQIKGRLDAPGRPLLYVTTQYFLEYFGLDSIKDLPQLPELEAIVKSDDRITYQIESAQ